MWMTGDGARVLQGAHAVLIRNALAFVTDIVKQKADGTATHWQFNVPPFDQLSWEQQMVLLSRVGSALLSIESEAPSQSSLIDATAAVLYAAVRQAVEIEIDDEELFGGGDDWGRSKTRAPSWRKMVLATCREEEIDDLPSADSPELADWEILVECLAAEILWDFDWQVAELFLDADPGRAHDVKKMMGIEDDYFIDVAPDPNASQVASARQELKQLLAPILEDADPA
jgi:hypothetical protein